MKEREEVPSGYRDLSPNRWEAEIRRVRNDMALNKGYIAIVRRMVPEIKKYFVTAVANTRRYECTTRDGNTHTHFTFIILLYDMTSRDKKLLN